MESDHCPSLPLPSPSNMTWEEYLCVPMNEYVPVIIVILINL